MDKKTNDDNNEEDDIHAGALNCLTAAMAETAKEGLHGAMMTSDKSVGEGCCVVKWKGEPCSLQEDTQLNMHNPPVCLEAGELACDAEFLNPVPRAKQWHTPAQGDNSMLTIVRMQHVVLGDMILKEASETNQLPNACNRRRAINLHALHVSNEDHDFMLDETFRRENMDCNESCCNHSDSDSDDDSATASEDDGDSFMDSDCASACDD